MQPIRLLAFGQSKIVGGADVGPLPENWDQTPSNPSVTVFNVVTQQFEPASIEQSFPDVTGLSRGGSMVWHAALELNERTGRPVEMVIAAHGGAPIDGVGRDNTGWVGDGLRSEYYQEVVETVAAAGWQDVDLVIFGQGESNWNHVPHGRSPINSAGEYRAALDQFLGQLAQEPWMSAETEFIMPELVPESGGHHRNDVILGLNQDEIPTTHTAFASGQLVDTPPNTRFLVHWTIEGLQTMGVRLVEAWERANASDLAYDPFDYIDADHLSVAPHDSMGALTLETHLDAVGSAASETIIGNQGLNMIRGAFGSGVLHGMAGEDWLRGDYGFDTLQGGSGNDILEGGNGYDMLMGATGHDRLFGNAGSDSLFGGDGRDSLHGGLGPDLLAGGAVADHLAGNNGADTLDGGSGDDLLFGNAGADLLVGGDGGDRLLGGINHDTLAGSAGADSLFGGGGNDSVNGGSGNDRLYGNAGRDTLAGEGGEDVLHGGLGGDVFLYVSGADQISDFELGIDRLRISLDVVFGQNTDLHALAETTADGWVRFDFGAGNSLTLEGITQINDVLGSVELF